MRVSIQGPKDECERAAEENRPTGPTGRITTLTECPDSLRFWLKDLYGHRSTTVMLARKDFQTRYKRASFGVLWAVAVPALQATIVAVVFSHVVRLGGVKHYPVYAVSGVIAFSYFSAVLTPGSTAIVDGASLTDKVWFPRAVLVIVPALSSVVGLLTTVALLVVVIIPAFGVAFGAHLLLLVPGCALLVLFSVALSLLLSALHVYFRDVRFLVQAALMVWMYATPILYPIGLLGRLKPLVEANPMTGIVSIFHQAALGSPGPSQVELLVSVGTTVALLLSAAEFHRRHDRLFVDLL